eukprot:scaffold40_cov305-Pinguiococcus_pyrenoidosus.AAC.28
MLQALYRSKQASRQAKAFSSHLSDRHGHRCAPLRVRGAGHTPFPEGACPAWTSGRRPALPWTACWGHKDTVRLDRSSAASTAAWLRPRPECPPRSPACATPAVPACASAPPAAAACESAAAPAPAAS